MNLDHLELGLTALKEDSQKGVIGARGGDAILITDKEFEVMDKAFKKLGLPVSSTMTLDEMKAAFAIEQV